jgi:hypothetical protein
MPDLDTCVIDCAIYDAVARPSLHERHLSCDGCAGMKDRVCRRLPPCSPHCGRTDGKAVVWVRRERREGGAA